MDHDQLKLYDFSSAF